MGGAIGGYSREIKTGIIGGAIGGFFASTFTGIAGMEPVRILESFMSLVLSHTHGKLVHWVIGFLV